MPELAAFPTSPGENIAVKLFGNYTTKNVRKWTGPLGEKGIGTIPTAMTNAITTGPSV